MFQAILNKLKAILTPKKQESDCELTDRQLTILKDLLKLRTATLSKFEIVTDQLGKGLGTELSELEKTGWIESCTTKSELEPKVYHVSAKAFKLLCFDDKKEGLTVSIRVKLLHTLNNIGDIESIRSNKFYLWITKDGYLIPAFPSLIYAEYFPIGIYEVEKFDTSGIKLAAKLN
jgi:hypothetical protein